MANVYLMASSTSVGDPRLPRQIREFAAMENVPFRVVHFNNGMHGWDYTEAQYKAAFPEFLRTVRSLVASERRADLGHHHSGATQGLQRRHQRPRRRAQCHRANLHRCGAHPDRRPARPHDAASGSLPGHRALQHRGIESDGRPGRRLHPRGTQKQIAGELPGNLPITNSAGSARASLLANINNSACSRRRAPMSHVLPLQPAEIAYSVTPDVSLRSTSSYTLAG